MKKLLALIIALVLIFGVSTVVVAETSEEVTGFSAEEETNVTLLEESDTLAAVRAQLKQFFDEKRQPENTLSERRMFVNLKKASTKIMTWSG